METAWVQSLLQWVTANPGWSYFIVFSIAFLESIFVIGLLVPGVFLLFGVGAIIPTGAIALTPVLICASGGAVVGDLLSFWLGWHFRKRLYDIWPLRNYPGLITRGETYFKRHGGKSVLLGRFVGAVRPIIPAVAGVAGMRPLHFLAVDLLSAAAWAPCYILPGAILGASLGVAAEIASRLVVILVLALLLLWLVIWITRNTLQWLPANAERLVHGLLDWSQRHRVLGRLGRSLADPAQPEAPGLAILALILLVTGWLCLGMLWGFGRTGLPPRLDAIVFRFLQDLRSPSADVVAMAIAQLGDWEVYVPISISVLIALLAYRRRRSAAHWLAALLFSAALAAALSLPPGIPEPFAYYHGAFSSHYAAGHVLFATVVYGFLPVLLGSRLRPAQRWWYYGPFFSLIALIGFARLYLGAQWLSDVLIGMTLGFIWIGLLTLAYRRHRPQLVPDMPLLAIAITVIAAAAGLQWSSELGSDLRVYHRTRATSVVTVEEWQTGGYANLPAYRIDLRRAHGHPLNLQWAGSLREVESKLITAGWEKPPVVSTKSLMAWLNSGTAISNLPVLPQVHDGRHQVLMLRYPIDKDHQWVIRLWPSGWSLLTTDGIIPVWVGNVSRQDEMKFLHTALIPVTETDYDPPLMFLRTQLMSEKHMLARHSPDASSDAGTTWDGTVLLFGPH